MYLTSEKLRELAQQHVLKYTRMANSGSPTVNIRECTHYCQIWQGILDRGCNPKDLAPFERAEVLMALQDESGAEAMEDDKV